MHWGSVIPVAITGAVGLAGIGGTLVSARITSRSAAKNLKISISAEDRRAKTAEKRRIYANYLAALNHCMEANMRVQATMGAPEQRADATGERSRALAGVHNAIQEVILIGPT